MSKTRKTRTGETLVANYLWIPKDDNDRARNLAKNSKPKLSKHAVSINAHTIGLDKIEALKKRGKK